MRFARHRGHAFVIKKCRRSVGRNKDCYARSEDESFRVIDLKAKTTDQRHRKRPEWSLFLKGPQCFFKMFGCHVDGSKASDAAQRTYILHRIT